MFIYLKMEDSFHYTHHLFMKIGIILLEWERKLERVKKKIPGKRIAVAVRIKHFRSIYSRDALPDKILKECGIINLDDIEGQETHWVCYRNREKNLVEYFDPFGLIMPHEIRDLSTYGKIIHKMKYKIEKLFYVVIGVYII